VPRLPQPYFGGRCGYGVNPWCSFTRQGCTSVLRAGGATLSVAKGSQCGAAAVLGQLAALEERAGQRADVVVVGCGFHFLQVLYMALYMVPYTVPCARAVLIEMMNFEREKWRVDV